LTSDSSIEKSSIKTEKTRFPLELVFRELSKALIDSTSEWVFLHSFFEGIDIWQVFQRIMTPVIKFVQERLNQRIEATYDIQGVLLSVYTHQFHVIILERRQMSYLKDFMDQTEALLRKRGADILDAQIQSIKTCGNDIRLPNNMIVTTAQDMQPHWTTRCYAELLSSILVIHQELKEDLWIDR
jgi:hypothetical protein